MKAYLAGFQCCEFKSALVATPTSPIPAARPSGAMLSEGIEVVTGLVAIADTVKVEIARIEKMIFFIVVMFYCFKIMLLNNVLNLLLKLFHRLI